MDTERPEILMTPGPTQVPPQVLLASARPVPYHRGPGFGGLIKGCADSLRRIMFTGNDVLFFTGSGSLGMESAIVNLCSPGDRILVADTGNFGERFRKIAAVYGVEVTPIEYEWGQTVRADDISNALDKDPSIRAVYVQHSETSTGVVNDVEAVGHAVAPSPALYVVDTISGVGAAPLRVDEWGIDVAIGGSQKALMAPPGICFVTVSQPAWDAATQAKCPRFYTDWAATKKSIDADPPETPFTPAVTMFAALHEALRILEAEGIEHSWKRHEVLGRATREGVKALGLDIFAQDADRACTVTAVVAPEGIDGKAITSYIRKTHGIIFAPGQGRLAGKIFRIGHCGYYAPADILQCLAVLETSLAALGYPVKSGAAVTAAGDVFREAGLA
jgi:aspartate aminotransferase-like enzyme